MSHVSVPHWIYDYVGLYTSQEEEPELEDECESWRFSTCHKSMRVAEDFLRQVQENRFPKFTWPPDSDCPAYKYKHISRYVGEFELREESEVAEKFLDQVRKSWGYDVDCFPPYWMFSGLYPIYLDCELEVFSFIDSLKETTDCVIGTINIEAKKVGNFFELVRVNKAVFAGDSLFLLTLTMKDCMAQKTISLRAAVSVSNIPELEECKLISSVPFT